MNLSRETVESQEETESFPDFSRKKKKKKKKITRRRTPGENTREKQRHWRTSSLASGETRSIDRRARTKKKERMLGEKHSIRWEMGGAIKFNTYLRVGIDSMSPRIISSGWSGARKDCRLMRDAWKNGRACIEIQRVSGHVTDEQTPAL